ncbi:MAG TPA: hypothetical protein VN677_14875 [Gemmatimonadaceae bacterium]|jgi:hypothetical protein|nr:hypothetical protein [Gemmatimonadaceae bacterium]
MSLTRDAVRDAVERGGDEQMQLLRKHHEDAYPESRPTPGDVCRGEAERLNALGLGDAPGFSLAVTRVERVGNEVRLTHVFEYGPQRARLVTEPFTNYG